MKSNPSTRRPRPRAAAPEITQYVTGYTVTDLMLRHLLHDVRIEIRPYIATVCAQALRHPMTLKTPEDAARRFEARRKCAEEINRRAKYLTPYADLVGAPQPQTPNNRVRWVPEGQADTAPGLRHPLCLSCNDPLLTDEQLRTVKTANGEVTVHRSCVHSLVTDRLAEPPDDWDDETEEVDDWD